MNEVLLDAFRHNLWATRELLACCRGLPEEHLAASSAAAYGSIVATLNHIVRADRGYARRLVYDQATPVDRDEDTADFAQLEERVAEAERLWGQLLAAPPDPERVIVVDKGANEVRAGIFIAQALHHGNAHREQVCAILTGLGIDPPDLQAWAYAWETKRAWERPA